MCRTWVLLVPCLIPWTEHYYPPPLTSCDLPMFMYSRIPHPQGLTGMRYHPSRWGQIPGSPMGWGLPLSKTMECGIWTLLLPKLYCVMHGRPWFCIRIHPRNTLEKSSRVFTLVITVALGFMMGKAHGWGTFLKHGDGLGHCLVLGPLSYFVNAPTLGLYLTLKRAGYLSVLDLHFLCFNQTLHANCVFCLPHM